MIEARDMSQQIQASVRQALSDGTPLRLVGGGSKAFYGREPVGSPLEIGGHRGIVSYQPKELVVTVRAGTRLAALQSALAAQHQMLPFEPPHFGPAATVGGSVACGFSGPRRPYAGSARDFVLGVRIINGRGEVLRFGGEVMKNVAGYDVSRLMAGAMGTLGAMLDISFKVLPLPEQEVTLLQEHRPAEAIEEMNRLASRPLPLSGCCFDGQQLRIRLSGSPGAVAAGTTRVGGEQLNESDPFWHDLREQRLAFFTDDRPLWRLSLPSRTPPLDLDGKQLIEWGGAQRWLLSGSHRAAIRRTVEQAGGHATLFRRGGRQGDIFHPLPDVLLGLHRRLKQAFDPQGIFNPGRLYREV